ncbi:hypothetical protein ACLB2K_055895 [Fragaria x ananassa]
MNKAYDRIEWSFLEAVLLKMGFAGRWVSLIKQCISTVSLSVLVNGKPGVFFKPSRGLRQGDPLSPFLFLFVNDVLSQILCKLTMVNILQPVQIGDLGPKVSHFFFADDSLFFLRATVFNCEVLSDVLHHYCSASGQINNTMKSSLYFSPNTHPHIVQLISYMLNMKAVKDPGKYLGLPTIWSRSKVSALGYIRDTILKKIQGWKQGILSPAGKEILIKAVAASIPAYPMACFKFPKTLCNQINSALARFWWSNTSDQGVHWKDWNSLGAPKSVGGLGFRSLESFNLALLAKQAWRLIHSPTALWVQVLQARYFSNTSFRKAHKGGTPSWIWSSLLEGRNLLFQGTSWRIGNGCLTDMWNDKWLPQASYSLASHSGQQPPLMVNQLITLDPPSWNLTSVAHILSVSDQAAIQVIPLVDTGNEDKLIWPHQQSGSYTVRSGYHLAQATVTSIPKLKASSSHSVTSAVWKWIWNLQTLPKIKIFIWKAVSNFVATKGNLHFRHISQSSLCPICNAFPETIEHVLFTCPWVVCVWFAHPFGIHVQCSQITTLDAWIQQLINLRSSVADMRFVFTHISFLLWNIWKHRCGSIFNHFSPDPVLVSKLASQQADEFLSVQNRHHWNPHSVLVPSAFGNWIPPSVGTLKINTDATWSSDSFSYGLAALLRDSSGSLLHGVVFVGKAISAEAAEAQALLQGLKLAKSVGLISFSMEADCLSLISALKSPKGSVSWFPASWFQQIKSLAGSFSSINWSWISREANAAADTAAHFASSLECSLNWVHNPPCFLLHVLQSDAVSAPP